MALLRVDGLHQTKHPLYSTYKGMLARCNHPNGKYYKYYGGRGIKVCDEWSGKLGFSNFVRDMGKRPEGLTLDRVDSNGNYCKENCRWASMTEQALNRRLANVNTSGYAGVHYFKRANLWSAYIDFKGKRKNLGYFKKLADAVEARRGAEQERQLLLTN